MVLATLIRGGLVSVTALTAFLVTAACHAFSNRKSEGGLFAPVLLPATSVDFEFVAPPPGWPWLLLWLPIGLSLSAEAAAGRSGQVGR
ncbi:MAG TPA: hypothetical protein VN821_01680 [Candidatus Udaeobacter sp.]|nr:hypothetical protein [Candidatus Udaeobacter sp.]